MNSKKLYRTEGNRAMLAGVCGGIGEYMGIDPTLVRLITAVMILAGGLSLWVYVIAIFIIPKESDLYNF